jgi:long-chain fatty acid transport protein
MFWNPATLTDVEGLEFEGSATFVFIPGDVHLDPVPGLGFPGSDEGDIAEDAFVPSTYAAYRLNERIVFGVGINSPFGLVTKYDRDSVLSINGIAGTSKLFSLNLNPAVSVDVTDWLALGVGLQVQYLDAKLTRQALGPLGISSLEGDDVGFGFTAGVRVTPADGTEIGLGYRSFIEHELDGQLRTENAGAFDVTAEDVDLPDIVTLGFRHKLTERFRVMATAEWQHWDTFDVVTVTGGPAPISLAFAYDDGWFFSLGGEYAVTEAFAVRAGVGYELWPIEDSAETYRLPADDAIWLSVGLSYRFSERLSGDFGYTFSTGGDNEIHAAGAGGPDANGPFSGVGDFNLHYVAAAFKLKLN